MIVDDNHDDDGDGDDDALCWEDTGLGFARESHSLPASLDHSAIYLGMTGFTLQTF